MKTPHDSHRDPHAWEGFEIVKHKTAMVGKMLLSFLATSIAMAIIIFIAFKTDKINVNVRKNIVKIAYSCLIKYIYPEQLITLKIYNLNGEKSEKQYRVADICTWAVPIIRRDSADSIAFVAVYSIVIFAFLTVIGTVVLRKKAFRDLHKSKHIRGTRLIAAKKLNRVINKHPSIKKKKAPITCPLQLGPISFPPAIETQHILILGAVGTGKTNAINYILKQLRDRGEKIVLFDIKGDYCQKFYSPDIDLILNPLDERYCGWNFLNDINDLDLEVRDVAASIIPPPAGGGDGTEKYFREASADVLSVMIKYLKTLNKKDITPAEIVKLIAIGPTKLRDTLQDHPPTATETGIAHIHKTGAEGQIGGIMSTLAQFCHIFSLIQTKNNDFSLRGWWKKDGPGVAFLTLPPAYEALLSNYYSMIINILTFEALTWPDDLMRRRFVIIDELPALPRIQTIMRLIREGRSKGVSMIIGSQTVQAIKEKYGNEGAGTILDMNTRLFFRINNPQDTEIVAKIIGEAEIEEGGQVGHSMTAADDYDRVNANRSVAKKYVLLPTQISQLPDLTSIIKIANFDPAEVKWKYLQLSEKHPGFIKIERKNEEKEIPLEENNNNIEQKEKQEEKEEYIEDNKKEKEEEIEL